MNTKSQLGPNRDLKQDRAVRRSLNNWLHRRWIQNLKKMKTSRWDGIYRKFLQGFGAFSRALYFLKIYKYTNRRNRKFSTDSLGPKILWDYQFLYRGLNLHACSRDHHSGDFCAAPMTKNSKRFQPFKLYLFYICWIHFNYFCVSRMKWNSGI